MTTARKRSSGFSHTPESESQDLPQVAEETQEVLAEDTVTEPVAFVETFILPTADLGPRFVEEVGQPAPEPKKTPELQPRPKRQPRNVPRFSRTR
jgi:hypothetical protein